MSELEYLFLPGEEHQDVAAVVTENLAEQSRGCVMDVQAENSTREADNGGRGEGKTGAEEVDVTDGAHEDRGDMVTLPRGKELGESAGHGHMSQWHMRRWQMSRWEMSRWEMSRWEMSRWQRRRGKRRRERRSRSAERHHAQSNTVRRDAEQSDLTDAQHNST